MRGTNSLWLKYVSFDQLWLLAFKSNKAQWKYFYAMIKFLVNSDFQKVNSSMFEKYISVSSRKTRDVCT
jgi:hypothetical protein